MVYVLQPSVTAFSHLLREGFEARGPVPASPLQWDITSKGLPVPAAYLPASITRVSSALAMPDFYYLRDCEIIVSSRARAALEELVPGLIEYIEIKLVMPVSMQPADAFFSHKCIASSTNRRLGEIGCKKL